MRDNARGDLRGVFLQVRIDKQQDAFIEMLLKEYRKKNPRMTKSDVVRNIITGFEAIMMTPLYQLVKQLPQINKMDKDKEAYKDGVEGFLGEPVSPEVVENYKEGVKESKKKKKESDGVVG